MTQAQIVKSLMDKFAEYKDSNSDIFEENTIKMEGSFFEEVVSIVTSLDDDKRKNTIKVALKRGAKLNPKDIITVTASKIVIKKFVPPKPKLSPAEIIKVMKSKVDSAEATSIAVEAVNDATNSELNFAEIGNVYFMENHVGIIQKRVMQTLQEKIEDHSELPDGAIELYSAFTVKNNYQKILETFAERLIDLLIDKNDNAVKFVAYYDGDVEVDEGKGGKKFIKPVMVDGNGSKWNSLNLLPVVIQFRSDKEALSRKNKEIALLESGVNEITEKVDKLSDKIKKQEERLEELNREKENEAKLLAREQTNLTSLKSTKAPDSKIQASSKKIKELMKKDEEIFKEKNEINDQLVIERDELMKLREEKKIKTQRLTDESKKRRTLKKSQESIQDKEKLVMQALTLTLPKMRKPY
jgi:hypothetical protein